MSYFDTAIGNGVLSVHYQIEECRKLGGIHYIFLQIRPKRFIVASASTKDV